ncbi:MAG: nucleoside hydrolase [Bacillota bacterium]
MGKQKVILDVDPGHDDAVAILLAAKADSLDVLGISVVAGNQVIEKTVKNALSICTLGRIQHIPVYRGCSGPLVRDLITGASHGESGLDGASLPQPACDVQDTHSVDFIIDSVRANPGEVIVIPTGPLTNVAVAITKAPDLKEKIKRIVLMGGAMYIGNRTPSAEYNIWADPEAAKIVFGSGIPITMVPLEVTHKALIMEDEVRAIRSLDNIISATIGDLLEFFVDSYRRVFGLEGAALHDPCAVAAVIDPSLVKTQRMYVAIETSGELTTGRTVCDVNGVMPREPNVDVGVDLDKQGFMRLLFGTLGQYPAE